MLTSKAKNDDFLLMDMFPFPHYQQKYGPAYLEARRTGDSMITILSLLDLQFVQGRLYLVGLYIQAGVAFVPRS